MMRAHYRRQCLQCLLGCLLGGLALTAYARQEELNARDAFWSASDLVGKRNTAPAHKPVIPTSSAAASNVASNKTAKPKPSVTVVNGEPLKAGTITVSGRAPLGLRYSVLKRKTDGTFEEISPDSVFHAGDSIRLSVMSNQDGYLYIIEKGTSGKWRPLYPAAGQADTKLTPGTEYLIPGGQNEFFQFSGDPGEEKLFVMLTRTPETNLDQTIEALRTRQASGLNDQVVASLRQEVQSRDLVFTKSGEDLSSSGQASTDGAAGADKATYVVNKATNKTADPHIVVDVILSHK